jgi:hypothetical protein
MLGHGRPARIADETGEIVSVESYSLGELATYSTRTIGCLKAHLDALEAAGVNYVAEILAATARAYGFSSIEDAERELAEKVCVHPCAERTRM